MAEFVTAPWWRKQVNAARKKKDEKDGGSARDHYLLTLDEKYGNISQDKLKGLPPLRIPAKGGELFVSAAPHSPAVKGLQADLNAAANIGLRALFDPDWPGKWWYIPCNSTDFKPVKEKVAGSAAVDANTPLISPTEGKDSPKSKTKEKKNQRDIVNLWRDVSATTLSSGQWQASKAYWNGVEARIVKILGQRIPKQEEIPALAH
jgi:hypothetical protein